MIKEKSQTWEMISKQLGIIFARFPITPNTYSWLTLPFAVAGFFAIVFGFVIVGIVLFVISGILDLIDGAVARQRNQTTHVGAFLDGSLDRFIDFLLIFSYFWLPISTPGLALGQWLCVAIFFALMPSFEVAYANHRRVVDDPDEKIIWRILNRGEMYLLMLLIVLISIFSSTWAGYLLLLLVGLSFITTLQTLHTTLRHAKD